MENAIVNEERGRLAPGREKRRLFLKQKELLDPFRSTNAIAQDQYDKSLNDMMGKMGIKEVRI